MYILDPVTHETIWGGNRIIKNDNIHKIGHLYLVNGNKGLSNIILNGRFKGKKLEDVFPIIKDEMNVSEYDTFPLTIAIVDATKNLSIQVHPDDMAARELEGKKVGKEESWLFLQAPKNGWIYAGCECGSRDEVKNAVVDGKMEEITTHFSMDEDGYVCVQPGTLHAMTAGSLVFEIEYGSDYTYRFFDYNRVDEQGNARELHIEKALKAIRFDTSLRKKYLTNNKWQREQNYELCVYEGINKYRNESDRIECLSIIKGSGLVEGCWLHDYMSVIMLPDEEISKVDCEKIIVTRLVK